MKEKVSRRELKLEKKMEKETAENDSESFKTARSKDKSSRSYKSEAPEDRMTKHAEITQAYEDNLLRTKEETYRMYAEMIFHAETLYMFGDEEMQELKKDMDIFDGDLPIVERMVLSMKEEKEEKSKARKKSTIHKKGGKTGNTVNDALNAYDLKTEPLIEEPTELSSLIAGMHAEIICKSESFSTSSV